MNNYKKAILLIILSCGFQLFPQSITVVFPNGGEILEANSTQLITWVSKDIDNIKIEYSLSNGFSWDLVADSVDASLGVFSWNIPDVQISFVLIRISDSGNPSLYDISNNTFKIKKIKPEKIYKINGAQIKIMPLGDSITQGVEENSSAFAGYRSRLFDLLEDAEYNFDFVGTMESGASYSGNLSFDDDHEGYGGLEVGPPAYNSNPTMLDIIDGILTSNNPDIVLLHIGTNDLNFNGSAEANTIAGQIMEVITDHILVSNPNATIFLAKIIYQSHIADFGVTLNNAIQSAYDALSASEKSRIKIVNMYPELSYPSDFSVPPPTYDDVHPNEGGYNKMADKWFADMQAYFKPPLAGGTSPSNGASNQPVNLTITWNEPPAASDMTVTYNLQISEFSNFSTISYENTGISGNSDSPTGLKYGQTYYWRVRIDNLGWSETWSFTTEPMQVFAKVFLQGPYNTGTSLMNTTLNSGGHLETSALSQPYSGPPWNYSGTESVSSGFFASNSDIVDWVLVELRTGTAAATTVKTRASFIKSDGNIVGINGTSPVEFDGISGGDYYIVIRHRNHLAVMSANAVTLPNTLVTTYNFTDNQSKAFGTDPMADLGDGNFGMWAGDVNGDGILKYNLSNNDRALILQRIGGSDINATVNGYYLEDLNMDHFVKYNLSNNDRAIILINIGGSNINNTITTQVP